LPEEGYSGFRVDLTCCQIDGNNCLDNADSGGSIPCNSMDNLRPGEFCNEDTNMCEPPETVSAVPTLSEWGLIIMAGILGIVGYLVIRRRKASV